MPKVLQGISSVVPATYYIRILKGVFMRGVGFDYLWQSLAMLTAMFLVLSPLDGQAAPKGGDVMLSRTRIREVIRKEFIQLFRDRRTRPLLIVVPFVQLLIFGYVLTTDVRDVRVGLLDQARTRESRLVFDRFDATHTFNITAIAASPRDLEEQLLRGKIDLAIKIPPDFSSRIRKGDTASVQVIVDGSMSNMASTRLAYASAILERLNADLMRELYPEELSYGRIDARIRMWYNPNIESRYYYVPGIVAFVIMLISLLFTSMAIVRERESGTMEQLIVTPLKPAELILGKTIPYALISMIQLPMVTLFAMYWFEIPLVGSVALLVFAACLFLLSTLGRRPFHFDALPDAAAGHDDDVFLYPPLLHVQRHGLPDREHAHGAALARVCQSHDVFSGDHPGDLSQGRGAAGDVAAIRRAGDHGDCRLYGRREAIPQASGLIRLTGAAIARSQGA